MSGVDPGRLMFWGRWASETSLRHYVQESISRQLFLTAPNSTKQLVSRLLQDGSALLTPPLQPWHSLCKRPLDRPLVLSDSKLPEGAGKLPEGRWQTLYRFHGS
jgi:hypothetical protein